ncbi:hypothetical protein MA16_Dca029254 [Dendrobium catenatum]|uniref:Uncharacterized protein n=1 Tax=Dendrobium catenatum TaxID=906689 RepID=A0A2I0VE56_9ASPA|nr:hypothetical protein MA16_Dca029254 [Dendrobium catenatum]
MLRSREWMLAVQTSQTAVQAALDDKQAVEDTPNCCPEYSNCCPRCLEVTGVERRGGRSLHSK